MLITLFILSIIGGFLSGLLGIGGAVVMIPLMLAIPPLVGAGELTMSQVSGLCMLQVLASSISGCLSHRRHGFVHTKTMFAIGLPMGVCSLIGALFSKTLENQTMLILYACLVAVAFIMLLVKKIPHAEDAVNDFKFNLPLSIVCGGSVGFAAGIIGAGGGFVLIPLMVIVLKIPMRVTVGSSLGIIFISALMGSIGKALSMQVEWIYLLPVLLGAIPAARLGALTSKSISPAWIKRTLLILVIFCLTKTVWDLATSA